MKFQTNAKVITSHDNLSGFGFPARAATPRVTRGTLVHVTIVYMTSIDTLSAFLTPLKTQSK